MTKIHFHNSSENRIITLFKATKDSQPVFSSVSKLFLVTFIVTVAVLIFQFEVPVASSKKPNIIDFGTDQSTNIFPTEVDSSDWAGLEFVLSQDLGDDSLYQEFSGVNSAYVPRPSVPDIKQPATELQTGSTTDQDVLPQTESDSSADTNLPIPEAQETLLEEVTDLTEPVTDSASTTASKSDVEFGVVVSKMSIGYYPLAQLILTATTNTSTPPSPETQVEDDVPTTTDNPAVTPVDSPQATTSSSTVAEPIDTPQTETSSTTLETPDELTDDTGSTSSPMIEIPNEGNYSITLANFETADLMPGEFVTGMQLRASLGASLESALPSGKNAPVVEVVFSAGAKNYNVGLIVVDAEVSNAINGGYHLFSLPDDVTLESLASSSVTFTFHGARKDMDGVYLDAAWIELDTRVVTDEDFKKRGVASELEHLAGPELGSMVSDKLNFMRSEAPVFNLRYNSQRNSLVRGFRSLVGRDLVEVADVKFKHRVKGYVGVEADTIVTKDGLITFAIAPESLENMPPGEYTVEILYDEGGVTFEDSFNFQWGIITINPNKSEYETGETAHISIGALTPNGHTICDADFNLFVTDPDSYITRPEVIPSGLCDGNNVIDVPDFSALSSTTIPGTYKLYLERLDDDGNVVGFTNDTFLVRDNQSLSIERNGPTRIYPVASYDMELTVRSSHSYRGEVIERVPRDFVIDSTTADISIDGDWQVLTWDISLLGGGSKDLSYSFNAPDLSPFLFNLGPAAIVSTEDQPQVVASTSSSSLATLPSNVFVEHRQWQIASDAVGNMILFFDGASIPAGWDCLSCINDVSDPFYQRFVMASSTYNNTGGAINHNHTLTTSVLGNTAATVESGSGGPAINTHSHTLSPTVSSPSNLPEYRQLQVIQYTTAAGEPTTIPTGAIAIFDVASSSLPTNWNRYSAQDGRYVYGENTIGTTGGSNEHTHTVSGTTGGSTGGTARTRNGGSQTTAATDGHTHTFSTTTGSVSNEPPYIEVVLAQASTGVSPETGMIAMWTEDVDNGWIDISSDPSDPFSNRFLKASTTYGATNGTTSHSHADITNAVTGGPGAPTNGRSGSSGSDPSHTHNVNLTNFSNQNHLPPYITAVFGKRQGTDPVYDQESYRWYVNENAQTPTDPWPVGGGSDLAEREPITSVDTPVKDGDEIRLRINVGVTNASSTVGSDFKLQYAVADTCTAAGGWTDVGAATTSAIWRGYVNAGVTNSSIISSQLLASSTISATYEELGYATSTPNEIGIGDWGEWDFVLQHNGAAAGTNYCFRMVERDDTLLFNYSHYPQLYTNEAPTAPDQDKLFDNEKTASTSPWFYFTSTDAEGEKIHYQIEVDNNYSFASPEIDRDTIDDSSLFENQVLISDKAPFRQGEQIEFKPSTSLTNGTTYYWRVRAQDPEGSQDWGDWSTIRSFTIDNTLTASAWFQTETEQFDTNALTGIDTTGDQADLITGSTTGSMVSTPIVFTDGDLGTAWDNLSFNETDGSNVLEYQIEYHDGVGWALIPDSDLTGNSTGFGTSPVSLLGLDVDTYGTIRIKADFTANTGTPRLQDWTVNWGYRVETPTITALFPNEQTGTTTPTFEFTTTDPQSDSLTYQLQWSLTPDFAASTTRISDTDAGFVNIDNGVDLDPFDSGADIQFTIQPADVLTGTTTYWWRVRAKDTTGDDAWSFWTTEQSFTVIPRTEISTWFQTTEEQFDTDILSGTVALNTDSVTVATTASEAMIVYGEGTDNTPKYRQWDGSVLSSEADMLDVEAPIRWAVVQAGSTREEYVAVTQGTDGDVNAQVFATGVWADLQEMTTSVIDIEARAFDVAYETLSGDAMVAYCDGDADPNYAIWDGSSWTISVTGINLTSTDDCEWIELEADPTSDEIVVLSRDDAGNNYEAQVWNGSSWGNATVQGDIVEPQHAGMALMYEESGGQAIIVSSDGNPARFRWNSWNGTTWGTAATQSIGNDFEWGQMARDIGSDEIILCYQDEDSDAGVVRWTGSAWAGQTELTADANAKTDPAFACVFEDTSSRDNYILTTISSSTGTGYYDWNNTSWSSEASLNGMGDTATMQLVRTGDANILGAFFDDPNDSLLFSTWDGSAWSTTVTMESDASVGATPFGHPYYIAPRADSKEGTTIVSPGIDFDDGAGPYWREFSWNDTTPGTSEVRYYMQYESATGTWAFIPAIDLPDNDTGTTTGPYDLTGLDTTTYNVLRPYAELTCDGSSNCPTLDDWKVEWAGGITISGTIQGYDQSTNVNAGTVAVAVNGVLQTGKTGSISAGAWSINNVTVFAGDIVTVFVTGTGDASEAVGVTRYDGSFDIDGMTLYERHISLGSNDATTTPMTNADIGLYDFTNTEDVFMDLNGTTLEICADNGCYDAELYIQSGVYYSPSGKLVTHDLENNGTITAGSNTLEVNGSWDNNATTTMTGSTVVFAATSTTESIDSTGATISAFDNITFGTTTGNATWTLTTTLDADGDLSVDRGTLSRGTTEITVGGDLSTGANGFWTGISTTTFDGGTAANWSDANSTLQNVGYVVIDGTSKSVTLSGNVAAQDINIGANDTLDASTSNHDITVYGDWNNQNNFIARAGEVFFVATSTGQFITTNDDVFYDLTFNGIDGGWSFAESVIQINNDFTVATGTVTLPNSGTTTIAGSFDATGGTFQNNNGVLYFTSTNAETITFDGDLFTNVAYDLTFNGSGSWTVTDTNATSTNDVLIEQGTVNFPSGVMAIGGTLTDDGGAFVGGTGTVLFYGSGVETITAGGSSFNNAEFDGTGSWSFSDTNVTAAGDLVVDQGTLTLPSGTFTVGGSYDNSDTVTPGTGTVLFNSTNTGETVNLGGSNLYNMTFDSATGGWTLTASATTTGSTTIANADTWILQSGEALSVGGVFTNNVGGASTTWTGTTLSLESGNYEINAKTDNGDSYDTLRIAAPADISMWNSVAVTYNVDSSGSLYSQDHNAANGDLYIWGTYEKTAGNEYWAYATDFDGTDLTGVGERQVDVRFASGASAALTDTIFIVGGETSATTTIANQGAGTYTITVNGGTTTAQYYDFDNLGGSGVSFLSSAVVTTLDDGSFDVTTAAGSALTLSSTTIDIDSGKQIFNVVFSTSTAIAANNVSQTDGTPASFWWFRDGSGNLYGEGYDNDTGDPGSVRFDDSSLIISISGTVYDAGFVPITGGTCNGATAVVDVYVDGVFSTSTSCSAADGSFIAEGVTVIGDPTLTVFLDDASGGERASAITRTPTTNITDFNLYANRVVVRTEDTEALTIANLAVYDYDDDSDLQFIATTTNPNTLEVLSGNALYIASSSEFAPGGDITLHANAGANNYDGALYIADNATFTGAGTSTYTIGGDFTAATRATFTAASTTVIFNATTTGKSISASSSLSFYELIFNGSGGGWSLDTDVTAVDNMQILDGTVSGTADITLPSGALTGNGTLNMTGGTTTIASSTYLGGISPWTFYNLQLGNTFIIGTTTPLFTSTTTVSGVLTIESAHYLDAKGTIWDLAGTGNVFIENGTFQEGTSTVRYSGAGSNVLSTQYYDLELNASAGPQTYTATGLGIIVDNDLTVGGGSASTFDINTNDPAFDVNGDVYIAANGTLETSGTADFTIAGSYDNDGTLTANGGALTFDGAGTIDIAAGTSHFGNVIVDATGDVTVSENATSTTNFELQNANSFTLASGESLTVAGNFLNDVGGAATTWTNTTLRLIGGDDYLINASTTDDSYSTIDIGANTQIRMWNSDATSYSIFSSGSLYSQDHANVDGDLYIWGAYTKSSANDYWSYATDFDGTDLSGGSERKVDVYLATSSQVTITGGDLWVVGDTSASTTVQAQGSGDYGITIGGNASTTWNFYEVRDIDSTGLEFTATPTVHDLSNGDLEISVNGGSAMTVGGTVIDANPAQNYNLNRFALNGVASGFNVTATGTSVSSWRFVNHYGGRDGEAYDVDPDGDPGYVAWDDSAASITVAGTVYQDDTASVGNACTAGEISLYVAGLFVATTTCNSGTGAYSFSSVSYGANDSLIVYISNDSEKGAAVTKQPVSNITNLDIYESHVIIRHESTNALTIADMAVWDSSDDADIPFTAVDAGTDTLTLPADRKLIVWDDKTFEPTGNVTVTSGGSEAYGGSIQLYDDAIWSGLGTESLTIGGSFELNTDATFTASNGTTTFTTTGAGRTIDVNENSFNNIAFTGSGSWTISDATLNTGGDVTISAGAVTLPAGTSTISGSFVNSGGSFNASSGLLLLDGSGTHTLTAGGSDIAELQFSGGTYSFGDTNATTTGTTTINSGTVTLPSGTLSVGGDFTNNDTVTHNTSEIILYNAVVASLTASSSDLYSVTFSGGGTYTMVDESASLLGDLIISDGAVTLSSTTLSIGGSFDATGGTFTVASNTVLFNSADTGEIIDPGVSDFYNVVISAPTGGYTISDNATTTNNFTLASANSFTLSSGSTLTVEGVFLNSVGGSNTTWSGSTLNLDSSNAYNINTKASGGDQYETLIIGADSDLRLWNSAATTTTVDPSSSLYSQDHAATNGALYIFGDFHISTTTEYWSYETDFDGTDISGGGERAVTVSIAQNATTTVDGGTLNIVGASGNETTITNQGSGTYSMNVSDGTFNAQYYAYRNLNSDGLLLSDTPTISSLSYGDFELAVSGGSLISLSSTTLNANASLVITGNRFATTTAITGNNVNLTGTTPNAWTFVSHTGNLDGEGYDVDGVGTCESLRWDDSSCLLTQQTHYRWRTDDGGLEVPASEWYDTNWDARKQVRVQNPDVTDYTDAVVQLTVQYDSDMQADFDDLRFTDSSGTTSISHWTGSTTNSGVAEVWVKVPSLLGEETTSLFMYYNNPGATSSSSASSTFIAADDFEDGNITEYSGQTSLFAVDSSFAFDGSNGLDNTGNETGRANTGGIYRTDQTVSQGETFRFMQYVISTSSDETCALFGVQAAQQNYGVCFRMLGSDRISLVENAVDNDTTNPATILSSTTVSFSTGWYEVEVDWGTDDSMFVSVYDEAGSLFATTSASDSTYTSGGIGFTYWFNSGGWDSISSRLTLTTEPTILFGVEQTDGGATWKEDQNTAASFSAGDTARLRLAIENTGLLITNEQFLLEYAEQDTAPSCEAVNPGDYAAVPVQASCGSSPVCMTTSANVTNGASTVDLLQVDDNQFVAGEAREDPSNITGNLDLAQGEYTELEYVITPTINASDPNLCFRVTDNGSDYDTYLRVAKMTVRFDPVIDSIILNNFSPISLLPGTTTQVYATGTVSDGNGYTDLVIATSTFYRGGVAGGASCTQNNNNCYISTGSPECQFTNCSGNSCDIECYADIYFHADPTDTGSPYDGQEWFAFVEVGDSAGGVDFATSVGQIMNTLRAIDVDQAINYGALEVNADTGSTNASTTVINEGNVEINIEVQGTDLSDGATSVIPSTQQKFSTSTFTYSSCGAVCSLLSSTSATELDVELSKPTADTPPVEDDVFWGIAVPFGVNSVPHSGINVFTPVSP